MECPVCHSKNKKKIWGKYTAIQSAAYFCPPSRDEERNNRYINNIKKLWNGEEASVLECVDCDFAFGYPYFGGDEEFYLIDNEQKNYNKAKWDYDFAISNFTSQSGEYNVLDFGAGDGFFLERLGGNYQKYALEGSEITRNTLRAKGINVFSSMSEAIQTHEKQFDLIVMFQVLEHISQFKEVLESLHRLLKDDGVLIVSVPNIKSIIEQEKFMPGVDMIPNHINKWSENSLRVAFKNVDLEIVSVAYQPVSILRALSSILQVNLKLKAIQPDTLANKVYSIQNRNIRKIVLSILAIPAFFSLTNLWFNMKSPNVLVKAIRAK